MRNPMKTLVTLMAVLTAGLSGCGGDGDGGGGVATTPVKVQIRWAARSREIQAPASALSAGITLKQASPDGTNFAFTVNRNADPAAYTETYTSPNTAKVGTWDLEIKFFAQENGVGTLVGSAQTSVSLKADGTGIGSFATVGTIVSVEVEAGQSVLVGERKALGFAAKDADGNLVAVTPGSVFFQVVSGGDRLRISQGEAEGVASGPAAVTATVDGKTSPPQTVTVQVLAEVTVLTITTNDIVYDPVSQKVYASVPSRAGANGNSVTEIDPSTGTIGASYPIGSEPGKLALSGNGQYLYVALDGSAAVRRFDIPTRTAGLQFLLNDTPQTAADMEVLPGSPESVAVLLANTMIGVYDNGVRRPEAPFTGANVIDFSASASTLYGYTNDNTGFEFRKIAVDDTGVRQEEITPNLISGFGVNIEFDHGSVYATSGLVIDPEAKTLVGTFSLEGGGDLVRPDVAANRVYFLIAKGEGFTLAAYDATTFLPVASLDIPGISGGRSSLIRWGEKGLAFRTSESQLFLIKSLPGA